MHDVRTINWKNYVMNHAYGVKHYVLQEESVVPSMGYSDALVRMNLAGWQTWLPGSNFGKAKDIRPFDEMQKLVLGKESVKEAMAEIVKEKLSYYRGTLQMEADENKIYGEVEKDAIKSLNIIMSNYNHKALTWFAKFMKALT